MTAACEGALALGLRPGMPVTKAQAMVPDLRVEPADPEADLARGFVVEDGLTVLGKDQPFPA